MNTHRGIVNRLLWMQERYRLGPGDRVLQKTPISFDVSVWELFWPLLTGACLVVARPGGHRDPAYLVETIRRREITFLHFVPALLAAFLEAPGVERCVSLRQVVASGDELPADLERRFFSRLGARLENLYGPTEAAVDVTFWPCDPAGAASRVPIGRPVANTAIHLLGRDLRPVPPGSSASAVCRWPAATSAAPTSRRRHPADRASAPDVPGGAAAAPSLRDPHGRGPGPGRRGGRGPAGAESEDRHVLLKAKELRKRGSRGSPV